VADDGKPGSILDFGNDAVYGLEVAFFAGDADLGVGEWSHAFEAVTNDLEELVETFEAAGDSIIGARVDGWSVLQVSLIYILLQPFEGELLFGG